MKRRRKSHSKQNAASKLAGSDVPKNADATSAIRPEVVVAAVPSNQISPSTSPQILSAEDPDWVGMARSSRPNGRFVYDFLPDPKTSQIVPTYVRAELLGSKDRLVFMRLSGGKPDAISMGMTEGFSIRVPDEVELAASGQRVIVSVVARSASGAKPAEMLVAYSTNEVGNSGWKSFALGRDPAVHSFAYDVNPMIKGNGDFVGILPADPGAEGIEIFFIGVDVTARPSPGSGVGL